MSAHDHLSIELFCPECGQKLSLSVRVLNGEFQCPRCRTRHVAGRLISHNDTLPAIPIVEAELQPPAQHSGSSGGWTPSVNRPVPNVTSNPAYLPNPPNSRAPVAPEPPPPPAWGPPPTWQPTPPNTTAILPAPVIAAPSGPTVTPPALAAPVQAELVPALPDSPSEPEPSPTGFAPALRKALRFVSNACLAGDRRLIGFRWHSVLWISALGMLLGVARSFDVIPAWPHALVLSGFVLFVLMLAWARIVVIQNEASDDGWGQAIRSAIAGAFALLSSDDEDETDPQLSANQRAAIRQRTWATWLASGAVVLYTIASLLGLVPSLADAAGMIQGLAIFTVIGSVVLWIRGRDTGEQSERVRKFTTLSTEATEAEFLALPPVVELVPAAVGQLALVHRSSDELLRELLIHLPSWRPGRRDYEPQYEAALVRSLRRRFPGVRIETQVPVTPRPGSGRMGELGRLDVVLDGRIAIELKRNLHKSGDLDRSIGQILRYGELWREKGPLFLLVCESRPDFASSRLAERLAAEQRDTAPFRVLVGGFRKA